MIIKVIISTISIDHFSNQPHFANEFEKTRNKSKMIIKVIILTGQIWSNQNDHKSDHFLVKIGQRPK
jgi:hypothetical protein